MGKPTERGNAAVDTSRPAAGDMVNASALAPGAVASGNGSGMNRTYAPVQIRLVGRQEDVQATLTELQQQYGPHLQVTETLRELHGGTVAVFTELAPQGGEERAR